MTTPDPIPAPPSISAHEVTADVAAAREHLATIAPGDPEELAALVEILVDSARATTVKLVAAAATLDRVNIRFHAHTLKGSALTSGFSRIGAIAEALEHDVDTLSEADIRERVALVSALVDQSMTALAAG